MSQRAIILKLANFVPALIFTLLFIMLILTIDYEWGAVCTSSFLLVLVLNPSPFSWLWSKNFLLQFTKLLQFNLQHFWVYFYFLSLVVNNPSLNVTIEDEGEVVEEFSNAPYKPSQYYGRLCKTKAWSWRGESRILLTQGATLQQRNPLYLELELIENMEWLQIFILTSG